MSKRIQPRNNPILKLWLLGCSVPLLFASPAQAQCSRAEIEANIAKFDSIETFSYIYHTPPSIGINHTLKTVIKCGSDAINPLIAVLKNKEANTTVRTSAAHALGSIGEGSQEALNTLIVVLEDKDNYSLTRKSAAFALARIGEGSQEALNTLIVILEDKDADHMLRKDAAFVLGYIGEGSHEVLKALITVHEDKDNHSGIRASVADALGDIGEGSQEALKTLIAVLKDKDNDFEVRASVADALEDIGEGSQEALKTLIAVLKDKDKDNDFEVRASAADALGDIGEGSQEALKTLITILKDKNNDFEVRLQAAIALGSIGEESQEALKALIAVLENQNENSSVHRKAAEALGKIGSKLQKNKHKLSTKDLEQFITSFETAIKLLDADKENAFGEKQVEDVRAYLSILKTEKDRRSLYQILPKVRNGFLIHLAFWITLIFLYPKSPQLQAIFFWNPKIRKLFGLWYIDFALTWVPLLRRRLFSPFQDSLLSDADLESFDRSAYFPNFQVELKSPLKHLSLQEAIPEIKGEIVLEGESGLGKSMFLKSLVVSSKRIVVYLPAKKCENGVMDAIGAKLHGYVKEDPHFLQNLIYSGAMDICIDGLNEVTPDTRAKITSFVERYFKGNIILATQPLEWTPPSTSTARIYRLQPLKQEQIQQFLQTRQKFLPENASVVGEDYDRACQNYLAHVNATQHSPEEKKAVQRMLSNPMELSIVSGMLARGEKPDLLNLQQQQYNIMAADYQRIHLQNFPLAKFSETAYEMRLKDESAIPTEWHKELKCLERYKMVISRQFTDIHSKTKQEWYFRHDKIQEFFIVQTFLGEVGDNRLLDYMGDPRFRGVYFLLATMMPVNEARELRETLIQYAADTRDHTVSDTFIQLFRTRQESVVGVR